MTALLVQYRRAAVQDIAQAHEYLNREVSLELADRFVIAVEHTAQQMSRFAHAGSLFPGRRIGTMIIRRWPVKEFPRYYIYYTADDQRVTVIRLIHSARDVKAGYKPASRSGRGRGGSRSRGKDSGSNGVTARSPQE